jgi:hypothetical protein
MLPLLDIRRTFLGMVIDVSLCFPVVQNRNNRIIDNGEAGLNVDYTQKKKNCGGV